MQANALQRNAQISLPDFFYTEPNEVVKLKNRTNTNKTKVIKLCNEHILPTHNIINSETVEFLKSLLTLFNNGEKIESIIYSIGVALSKKNIREYQQFDDKLEIHIPNSVKVESDLLGTIYQYLTTKQNRLSKGAFYTNNLLAESLLNDIEVLPEDTFFDPACGSGNLFFSSKITNPKQIIGVDNDPIAIMCCKFNYYIKFGVNAPAPQIYCRDFFEFIKDNQQQFDYVICNPPFGATLSIPKSLHCSFSSEDSLAYFIQFSMPYVKKQAKFILPESVTNVKKHTELRKWILKNFHLKKVDTYNKSFSGTMFPIVILTLGSHNGISYILFDDEKVDKSIMANLPFCYFRPISAKVEAFLKKIFNKNTQSLKGSAFGLGVVTGDNKTKVLNYRIDGSLPIITGKDITKFEIKKPSRYIVYDRKNLQQVAPDGLYFAPEKVVYKTVSRDMIFALDDTATLTLNSANFFIPKNLTISTKCLVALLNSTVYNELNKILYGENKISRTNLENLPLPHFDKNTQTQIENYVDKREYEKIEHLLNNFFDL